MEPLISRLFGESAIPVIVVTGLPRSGTSMMMKILEVGGILPFTDRVRTADSDNPGGYYELERVKRLKDGDSDWMKDACGKAVKIITALVPFIPTRYDYRVIFMKRNLHEILASQRKMLINRNSFSNAVHDDDMMILFQKHLEKTEKWLNTTDCIQHMIVDYNQLLSNPFPQIEHVNLFLGGHLNLTEMMKVIDPTLYRQKF